MPPAILAGAIALGASYALSIGAISFMTAMVITVAATVGASLIMKQSLPSLGNYVSQAERKQVLRSSAAPQTRIYGKTVVSGTLFFAEEEEGDQADGEWVHLAIVLAGHAVDRIGAVWLGDDRIETYGSLASYEVHINRTTADPYMLSKCPSWKSDMIGKGLTWLRVSLKFDQEKFPAGLPNIKCEVYGQKCYDPRNGNTVWTDNPALCILDYYRNVLKIPDAELIMSDYIQGANICDETVTNGSGQPSEKRYRLNGAVDMDESRASILDDMHETCAGEPTYIGGQHGLLVGAYYGPATMVLNESQIVGDIKVVPETSFKDKVNIVSGTFIDPAQGYVETDFPPVRIEAWIAEDGNEFNQDQKYRLVTSAFQAQRLAQIKLNRQRLGRTIELSLNMWGYRYRPGYYVLLTVPTLGITRQEFRVTKWELQAQGGVNVTLRQETAAVWAGAVGQPLTPPDLTNLPGASISAPTNVQFIPVAASAEVNYQGEIRWTNPTPPTYTQVIIQGGGKTIMSQQTTGTRVQVNGLDKGIQYTVSLRNTGKGGLLSSITTLQFSLAIDSKYYGDIYAQNGYFAGTIFANKIVGDIYNRQSGGILKVNPTGNIPDGFSWAGSAGDHVLWAVEGEDFDRVLDSNLILFLQSGQRQTFTVLVRTPGRPDNQVAYHDTGNNGENGPMNFTMEGLTMPIAGRGNFNQIVVRVGENRNSSGWLKTPLQIDTITTNNALSGNGYVITASQRETPWVAIYRKGSTIVTSAEV